ncbi:ABC transporter permease [Spiroplasma chrysopicola]|uniref:Putative ABC transporter permease n=1 Tax=Spiroplasma chrysopicola DF-1 TaxID=1276227 RepID=R4U487_9MOLU|nr:ABC transporter permease [Spiroplasma chrysopicola]AGM25373.1 putative ABC transporter permease [Spiroplasma chrysopicola DF-1]
MLAKTNKKNNFRANFSIFQELMLLINKSFFREKRGPIFIFVIPTIFLIIFYYVFNIYPNNTNGVAIRTLTLFIYMLLPTLSIIVSLSTTLVDWKKSVFLKRIDATGIKKGTFLFLLLVYYLSLGLIAVFFEMIIAIIIGGHNFIEALKTTNWGYLLLGIIAAILLSITMAFLIGGIFSNEGITNSVAIIIYILTILLSGVLVYPPLISDTLGVRVITYFIPHKYPIFLIFYAITGVSWEAQFNTGAGYSTDLYHYFTATWQPVVGIILFLLFFTFLAKFSFRWNVRR